MLRFIVLLIIVTNFNHISSDPSVQKSLNNVKSESVATSTSSSTSSSSTTSSSSSTSSSSTSSSSSTTSFPTKPCPSEKKCGKNQVYDTCPAPCPPRTCETKDLALPCIPPPQPGDPNCPQPKCRCADGFYSNAKGECVTKEQCPKCGKNQVYDPCPSSCPPRTCATKDIAFSCVTPLQPGDPKCPSPKCRCANGFYSNDQGECVPKEECPTKTCGSNEIYVACSQPPCPNQLCENIGKVFPCPIRSPKSACIGDCQCKPGYYRNKIGQCISEEDCKRCPGDNEYYSCGGACDNVCSTLSKQNQTHCPIINIKCNEMCYCLDGYARDAKNKCIPISQCPKKPPKCGKNEVYDPCPSSCPPRTCATKDIAYKCKAALQPGDPNCPAPKCRCAQGYYSNDNGDCVPKEQCPTKNCGTNEVYVSCPVPTCANQTCENIGKKFNCPLIPSNYTCKGECQCKSGYYRNKIGQCITEEECKRCTGENEYYSCGGACDNVCSILSTQNQTHCPIVNIKCNEMCYCLDGYARDANNKCIPISECPPECKENEEYSDCPNICRAKTCDDLGFPLPCFESSNENNPNCGEPSCICQAGYVRNKDGECISNRECPSCGGDVNAWSGCGVFCDRCPKSDNKVPPCPKICKINACDCRPNYVYNEKTEKCVLPEQCPPLTCGENEVYVSCPVPTCANQTCENIGKKFNCPLIPSNYTCKGECQCKTGYYRNKIGKCITEEECKQCPGENEYYSCGGACDNVCSTLSKQNQTHCPIINVKCNEMCYCLDGYARDANNNCIPISQCPPECKENEEYSNCPNDVCRAKSCDDLGYPLACLQISDGNTTNSCGEPGCICQAGYVKDKNGECISITDCPSCKGDPNAMSGCGVFCKRCSNYLNKGRACPLFCQLNGCECRPDYVYNEVTKKCVLPENCPPICGSNEVASTCADDPCIKTCETKDLNLECRYIRAPDCNPGCVCADGYLRDNDGVCVPIDKCPPIKPQCNDNEEYSDCPNKECRPKDCKELGFPLPCNQITGNNTDCGQPGCICKNGLLRNKDGVCVDATKCPSCRGDPNAGPGCGSFCTRCNNYKNKNRACSAACLLNGCECRENYVYEPISKKCILPSQCPLQCGQNEVVSDCANSPCIRNCATKDLNLQCKPYPPGCKTGCVCADGYLRNEKGVCVPINKCPPNKPECNENEEYSDCTNQECRPRTCDELGFPLPCNQVSGNTTACEPSCICKSGFVRNKDGVCVDTRECPSCGGDPNAGPGCGTFCNDCDNYQANGTTCSDVCNLNGCACRKDYVYDKVSEKCVLPSQCPKVCKEHEEYSECPNRVCRAKSCNDLGYPLPCYLSDNTTECGRPGCICELGYVKNSKGLCVSNRDCPSCGGDANAWSGCGIYCTRCSNYKSKNTACILLCILNSCDCRPGYVYDEVKKTCVLPEQCPCGANEVRSNCIDESCLIEYCSQKDLNIKCKPNKNNCKRGCLCAHGYLRADNGTCIPRDQCPPTCGPLEEYSDCANAGCDKRYCSQVAQPDLCIDVSEGGCRGGCVCQSGYLRNAAGDCVPISECPSKEICPKPHEYYDQCPASCPRRECGFDDRVVRCKAPSSTDECNPPSCRCEEGYYRNSLGECVTFEECPKCGPLEVYSDCANAGCAKRNCSQVTQPALCIDVAEGSCRGGCVCQPDYLRTSTGECVPVSECPSKDICPKPHEYYDTCPPSCPARLCGIDDRLVFCRAQSTTDGCKKPSCRCEQGYYRDPYGECVTYEECPKCGVNEVYDNCPSSCPPRTCETKDRVYKCPAFYEPGDPRCPRPACRCADNYFRNSRGQCVTKEQCPIQCGINEVPSDCATNGCLPTCAEPDLNTYCDPNPDYCKPGCVCADGYLRDKSGVCVLRNKCPPNNTQQCGPNEVASDCGNNPCLPTCSEPDRNTYCKWDTRNCKPGCLCADGYLRDENGTCVCKKECPKKKPQCGPNEVVFPCANSPCLKTCGNKNLNIQCKFKVPAPGCKSGCICADGYYKNKKGVCVPADQCEPLN